MTPSIGRIVHYFVARYSALPPDPILSFIKEEGEPYTVPTIVPAIITHVHTEELVNLRILGGPEFGEERTSVPLGGVPDQVNTWIWPPRV